jgi:hypothetical protein
MDEFEAHHPRDEKPSRLAVAACLSPFVSHRWLIDVINRTSGRAW